MQHEIILNCHKMPIYQFHPHLYKYKSHIEQSGIYSSRVMINIQTIFIESFLEPKQSIPRCFFLCEK